MNVQFHQETMIQIRWYGLKTFLESFILFQSHSLSKSENSNLCLLLSYNNSLAYIYLVWGKGLWRTLRIETFAWVNLRFVITHFYKLLLSCKARLFRRNKIAFMCGCFFANFHNILGDKSAWHTPLKLEVYSTPYEVQISYIISDYQAHFKKNV